ncbi:MAG: CoA-binding protein [Dehalococcoidia bacterium]
MDVIAELDRIFNPRGIAIIGASNRPGNLGYFFLSGFIQHGFDKSRICVVHPTETRIDGVKVYHSACAIPFDVDLAIVFSPRDTVAGVVRDCAAKGIKGIVICTSGFGESGAEGMKLQKEITRIARAGGSRIIGPNCVGIFCPDSGLTNFAGIMPKKSGSAGMFSHSGSMSVSFPIAASGLGINFNKSVSYGNECDLNAADFLEYFGQDARTDVVVGYVEGVSDGRRFFDTARRVSERKPVILWKSGASEVGSRSAASHTGALAGSPQVWGAVFKQTGMIKVDSEDEMLDCLQAFSYLPLPRSNRVGIISSTGGIGVAIADACTEYGLSVARLSDSTRRRLKKVVPSVGTCVDNPVDIGMASSFDIKVSARAIEALVEDENIDVIFKAVGGSSADYVRAEVEALKGFDKPIVLISNLAMKVRMEEVKPIQGLAVYQAGRRAALMVSKMVQYRRYLSEDTVLPVNDNHRRKSAVKAQRSPVDAGQFEELISAAVARK